MSLTTTRPNGYSADGPSIDAVTSIALIASLLATNRNGERPDRIRTSESKSVASSACELFEPREPPAASERRLTRALRVWDGSVGNFVSM